MVEQVKLTVWWLSVLWMVLRWLSFERPRLLLSACLIQDSSLAGAPKVYMRLFCPLLFPVLSTAGDLGLGEGLEWQSAGEAHGQSPPRTDSQSGDCLGRIMGMSWELHFPGLWLRGYSLVNAGLGRGCWGFRSPGIQIIMWAHLRESEMEESLQKLLWLLGGPLMLLGSYNVDIQLSQKDACGRTFSCWPALLRINVIISVQ